MEVVTAQPAQRVSPQNVGAVVTGFSQHPTLVLLIVAAVMVVLGTFVDSLAVLLTFAPVAIQISKAWGIDPFQWVW